MSSRLQFGTLKRIVAILIAILVVLAAGIVVGQAPAIFGVDEDPEASITFEDQQGNGTSVEIAEVSLSDGGFVVITDGGEEPLVVSEYLESGTHENVTIERAEGGPELVGQMTATVHRDTDDDETYTYGESDGEEDRPYLADGFPVSDTATVTTADDGGPFSDSFLVESIDAPAQATTNETIEVVAEVRNPTEFATQQNVDIRIDGRVIERQVVDLDAGESREVTFSLDTTGLSPGERTVGVYTDGDGALADIVLEFHTDPSVSVVDADDDGVTVDVAIPEEGFVAIEDGDTVVGTSEGLDPGEYANVTAEFDENATVDEDAELTATLYAGDPGEVDAASPIEYENEPVETTFTIADARAETDAGNETSDD
ncbi:CARDB domain-containing protein [Halosolutus amylolyticus]|uniref:CARDB domain-containing protein n=1 Tax=Halosolutus amylolyticus TaxID=2932267 RepID=A0ABD5PJC9_9EURY|nr:CARDB domain-containing protein [Halosolutus amylolyticus]